VVVPIKFRIVFGLKYTIMAIVSGAFLGWFLFPFSFYKGDSPLPMVLCILGFALGSALISQVVLHSYLTGKRRGEFEYAYQESLTEQRIRALIKMAPINQADRDASFMVSDPTPIILRLMDILELETEVENKFWLHLTLASLYGRTWEYTKAMTQIEAAAALKPNDLVANFRLAEALERTGKGDEAIRHYEAALDDPSMESGQLKEFVVAQVQRVRTHGPSKDPQYPFKKYIWG
jgi:tetratricopeptide (TPR) repeat protein